MEHLHLSPRGTHDCFALRQVRKDAVTSTDCENSGIPHTRPFAICHI